MSRLLVFFTVLLLMGACNIKQSNATTDPTFIDFPKLVEVYNISHPNSQQWFYYSGDVKLRNADKEDVIVTFDFVDDQGDKRFYRLQQKEAEQLLVNFKNVELIYAAEALFLVDQARKKYTILTVNASEATRQLTDSMQHFTVSTIDGFGLAVISYRPTADLRAGKPGDPPPSEVSCECKGSVPPGGCKAGGLGSISCSISSGEDSCTVTCKEHVMACCNSPDTSGNGG